MFRVACRTWSLLRRTGELDAQTVGTAGVEQLEVERVGTGNKATVDAERRQGE